MAFKASNYLPLTLLILLSQASAGAATSLEADLNESVQKKDWPGIVLLLQPRKGQNFEHDLLLAKAFLSLERRQEAIKLLNLLQNERKDERVTKLLQTAGTLFFAQETANNYYESLQLIRELKFAEANERLEQALSKEPGNFLLLTRLIQTELFLGQWSKATTNLENAQATGLPEPELKLFAAKLALNKKWVEEEESDLLFALIPAKAAVQDREVTLPFWIEGLKRAHKQNELEALATKTLKEHPLWTYALMEFAQNPEISGNTKPKLILQMEKNLKVKETFLSELEIEMKKDQYFWAGYVVYETLITQLQSLRAAPSPAAH